MRIGTAIIIFFLAIIALVAEFILYMIFGFGAAFSGDFSSLSIIAFFFVGLMIMSVAAGVLAPLSALLGMAIKNHRSSLRIYIGLLILIFIFMIGIGIFGVKAFNSANKEVPVLTKQDSKGKKQYVELEITKKGFFEGDFQNQITMDLKFTNKTSRDIKGVEGVITFYDIFDNKITATKIAYDKGIQKNGSELWSAGIDYNRFIDTDVKLKDTELNNLKYKWEAKTIIYEDGSKETFN